MKLAVSSWSFHREIGREFAYHEFPAIMRERYGIGCIEMVNRHFPSPEATSLDRLAESLAAHRVELVNIAVDWGNIADPDARRRRHDLDAVRLWIGAASYLGCPAVRVNSGRGPDVGLAIDSYRELASYAAGRQVTVVIENHGGFSSDPAQIVRMVEEAGPNLGTCPDFGNFPDAIRYDALAQIAPYARVAHVKAYDFAPDGSHPRFDIRRCLDVLRDAGFDGPVSIEFEGTGDPWDGVQRTADLVRAWEPGIG